MTDRYDPHRAHPDTVLAILRWHLGDGAGADGEPIAPFLVALRDQCRLRTQAEMDALLAARVRLWHEHTGGAFMTAATMGEIVQLCAPANSGPPGAAAKESREDIAAPGGATTETDPVAPDPGERPCGCEETEELEKQLAALRARNFELAMVLSRVRKLINEPWKP